MSSWTQIVKGGLLTTSKTSKTYWYDTDLIVNALLIKNLIVNGLVLANDGQKMSKRLKNYPDPMDVVNKYGADALRLFLINSPVVKAENLRFRNQRKFVSAKPENYGILPNLRYKLPPSSHNHSQCCGSGFGFV